MKKKKQTKEKNLYRPLLPDGTLASPNFYYRFCYKGKVYRGSTKVPYLEQARQILTKRFSDVVAEKELGRVKRKPVPSLAKYAQAYLDGYALNKKSRASDQSIINQSLKPAFGRKRLDEISPEAVERWKNKRLASEKANGHGLLTPAMVQREMACLKTMLNLALRDGLIEKNPVSLVRMPKAGPGRDRVVTPAEYQRLLAKTSAQAPHMRPILVLAYETGMRRGEILGLTRKDLQKRPGFAHLPETKNGDARWVPLNEEVKEALRAWPRRVDTDVVFAHADGTPVRDIKTAWKSLCKRARVRGVRFHDLRHTFVTRMLEAGRDIRTIMAITGHKSVAMFKRYSHPSAAHLQAAVEDLSGHKSGHTVESGSERQA